MKKNLNCLKQELKKKFRGILKSNELLSRHTTFRIGGTATLWAQPKDLEDLKSILQLIKKYKVPFFIIGAGSNILVKDKGFSGVVINFNSQNFKNIILEKSGNKILLNAGSALAVKSVLDFCIKNNLSGFEFISGIPGTIGGSLIMNAGANSIAIGDIIEEITAMNRSGRVITLDKKKLKFNYRRSNLSKYIILSTKIRLQKANKQKIRKRCQGLLKRRWNSQEMQLPSAGCIFKNPFPEKSAGMLIDLCGFKGKRIGGAQISSKHANFIVNRKNASARDVLALIELIREEVKRTFAVTLTPEIKII